MAGSPPSSSFSSSPPSPSFYPSSHSSLSPPLISNFSSASRFSHHSSDFQARDHLESLITKHGHPTPVSLSSLRDLTATSSTYNPPSPLYHPSSPVSETIDSLEAFTFSDSSTRPIPIPKRSYSSHEEDLPVTPLTGRFDTGYYFPQNHRQPALSERASESLRHKKSGRHGHSSRSKRSSRMRSDSSTFYSPVVSPTMSPAGRPSSPQPSHSRTQGTTKSVPSFHLGNLPRFHPAVYQQPGSSQDFVSQQPPSPRQSRQNTYRTASGSRENNMWQYRELVESVRTPTGPLGQSPSAPRLDPLSSPGPVTPLALEDAGGYLASGATNSSDFSRDRNSGAAPDLVERLLARESERTRQKARKTATGR